jgi:hypothetical protein
VVADRTAPRRPAAAAVVLAAVAPVWFLLRPVEGPIWGAITEFSCSATSRPMARYDGDTVEIDVSSIGTLRERPRQE